MKIWIDIFWGVVDDLNPNLNFFEIFQICCAAGHDNFENSLIDETVIMGSIY